MPPLKDLLGKPGQGIHFHVCGVAVVDVVLTVVAGCLVGWLLAGPDPLALLAVTSSLFLTGELLHLAIGVETTVALAVRKYLGNE